MWKQDFVPYHGGFLIDDASPCLRKVAGGDREPVQRPTTVWHTPKQVAPVVTPRPKRTREEYQAERRSKHRNRKTEHAKFQTRLVKALVRSVGVEDIEAELPYSIGDLRIHLERQFKPGMSWSNHASSFAFADKRKKWCIDHIVPKVSFHKDDIHAAFALSNLRPIWWKQNMVKAAKRNHLI